MSADKASSRQPHPRAREQFERAYTAGWYAGHAEAQQAAMPAPMPMWRQLVNMAGLGITFALCFGPTAAGILWLLGFDPR